MAAYPKPTAQVEPYVNVLGTGLTIRFLLAFGGAELHLPKNPKAETHLVQVVGLDKARALGRIDDYRLQRRVPLAKRWLAGCLRAEGATTADIARTLRVSDHSVRQWFKS